jgi:hypothetical protein
MAKMLDEVEFPARVIALGWADHATLEDMKKAFRAWGEHPDAFFAASRCEAVGWKA